MTRVFKYILALNLCLAVVSMLGSAWSARTVGSQAYLAGAVAAMVVGIAASLALLFTFLQSRQTAKAQHTNGQSGVSGVLIAMFVRMGLPIAVIVLMQQLESPLLKAGFMGLLALNYLVALSLETFMSLKLVHEADPKLSGQS